ncbi:MAG: hypothetical protein O2923_12410 [Verrucomicrobia bacterium]|nr:hypothetical protein [Verrucomicrobiota bacterium]MDA1088347.1 hypothetical protein [Verrucomicrobiota bacterium]
MNGIDMAALAYMVVGFFRGRKRGLGVEVYRLIRMAVPVVAGCGMYGVIRKGLAAVPALQGESAGLVGFIGVTGGAFLLMMKGRGALLAYLERKFDQKSTALKAGLAGLLRTAIVSMGLVTAVELSPADFATSDSQLGSIVRHVLESPDKPPAESAEESDTAQGD